MLLSISIVQKKVDMIDSNIQIDGLQPGDSTGERLGGFQNMNI